MMGAGVAVLVGGLVVLVGEGVSVFVGVCVGICVGGARFSAVALTAVMD